jgi:hypothetical protein
MTELEISFNPTSKKFSLVGPDAMDHISSKKVSLNMAEIMQIINLYKKGVFFSMLTNNIVKKTVNVEHKSKAEIFLMEEPAETITSCEEDDDSGTSSASSASSASSTGKGINLWQVYLKHVKATHPELTHKQAMQLGKSGCSEKGIQPYAVWKLNQVLMESEK